MNMVQKGVLIQFQGQFQDFTPKVKLHDCFKITTITTIKARNGHFLLLLL